MHNSLNGLDITKVGLITKWPQHTDYEGGLIYKYKNQLVFYNPLGFVHYSTYLVNKGLDFTNLEIKLLGNYNRCHVIYHGSVYSLTFTQSSEIIVYPQGKAWPKQTHCVLKKNDTIMYNDTIIKHANDEHNLPFALKKVGENVLLQLRDKWLRGELRKSMDTFILEVFGDFRSYKQKS